MIVSCAGRVAFFAQGRQAMTHAARFQHLRYTIRRKFFRLFGDAFHLYTDTGELALYSNMKRFRIREDIRLYSDESQEQELHSKERQRERGQSRGPKGSAKWSATYSQLAPS